jgi:hypothetical protein
VTWLLLVLVRPLLRPLLLRPLLLLRRRRRRRLEQCRTVRAAALRRDRFWRAS